MQTKYASCILLVFAFVNVYITKPSLQSCPMLQKSSGQAGRREEVSACSRRVNWKARKYL